MNLYSEYIISFCSYRCDVLNFVRNIYYFEFAAKLNTPLTQNLCSQMRKYDRYSIPDITAVAKFITTRIQEFCLCNNNIDKKRPITC